MYICVEPSDVTDPKERYFGDKIDASKGNEDTLYVCTRAQQNFNENIPLALVVAALAELNGADRYFTQLPLAAMKAK